jgi:Xaa-Pro aminopeptidase
LENVAGVFIDGRYTVQVKMQVDEDHFTPVDWPATLPANWLCQQLPEGGTIGYDPLHYTPSQIKAIEKGIAFILTILPVTPTRTSARASLQT